MRRFGRLVLILLLVAAIAVLFFHRGRVRVLRLSDGKFIGLGRMVAEVRPSRLIFVGEEHDRKETHAVQLEVIRRLHEAGADIAIGMEMFTADSQGELDRWVAGNYDLHDFIRFYYREWEMPWPLYRDILVYARDHGIPIVGLNVPHEVSYKVAQYGFDSLTPAERKHLPTGVTCTVGPAYMKLIRRAYAEPEHKNADMSFTYFCEAQMLWNKSMGKRLKEYLAAHPQKKVVVLAGVGHAMKLGIPNEVAQISPCSCSVILPESPGLNRRTVTREDADYLVLFDHLKGT
jgi:uncharacterized iron-regulated protein